MLDSKKLFFTFRILLFWHIFQVLCLNIFIFIVLMSETINFVTNTLKGVGREPDCQPSGSVICYLSEDDAKKISWPWLSMIMTLVMTHHFMLLWLNPSALWRLTGMVVWALCAIVAGFPGSRRCKKRFLPLATCALRMG